MGSGSLLLGVVISRLTVPRSRISPASKVSCASPDLVHPNGLTLQPDPAETSRTARVGSKAFAGPGLRPRSRLRLRRSRLHQACGAHRKRPRHPPVTGFVEAAPVDSPKLEMKTWPRYAPTWDHHKKR